MTFDPLTYLDLYLQPEVKELVSQKFLDLLSQYLIIRTLELLPEEKIEELSDPEKLFELAKTTIPDYNEKVKEFLSDFKEEYRKNTGKF